MFSSVRQGGLLGLSRRVFCSIAAKGFLLRYGFCSIAAALCRFALAQAARAFFRTSPQQHVISFARTKETKQRKFAVCTFWTTPALFSAKQKELASLKQLFVFHAPKSTSASRLKSEAGPLCFFYATSLRSLGCDVFFFSLRSFFLSSRAERRISFTSTPRAKRCALQRGLFPASVEEREEKSSIFR